MSRRIAIILGHPDPAPERFCRALAAAYAEGARTAGHTVTLVDLSGIEIPFLRSQTEFETGPVPENLAAARDAVVAADHLVLIFPLWLGTMPALVKAFLEHIARPGIAFRYRDKGLPEKLFAGKSARVVVTMGMPAFVFRWFYLAHGIRGLKRSILSFVGVAPVRETYIGGIGAATPERRAAWLATMAGLGKDAA
ncbi:NAD(P)H-dependent oxidoreductase [Prosthecodimorpha staleyi]|uniref:NAD(P)H-dependent oxidoreductase n=1 Tax=Prosthecodimorpha staleyi TaxID=2840188 RepID=A0A947D7W3_9HYPH|nr:NAD(P)H-dependent oxidoreductase [Prosthecodimorpha staleyi]MBT9291729.1 NAD(P)H-dependent oxidoreductase [Prosthecodimorpha staleyi]